MSDNKENNQDFIEENDVLAESLDNNFPDEFDSQLPDIDDEIIEMNSDSVMNQEELAGSENFDDLDEWSEDFDDADNWSDDRDVMDSNNVPPSDILTSPSGDKNWFNIAIFGVVGIFACFMMYSYFPGIFGFGSSNQNNTGVAPVRTAQQSLNNTPQMDSAGNNETLAQEALSGDAVLIQEAGGLLSNPDLLGDGLESLERDDPDAAGNAIFEALNNAPKINEVDIFSAFDDVIIKESDNPVAKTEQQTASMDLPEAADQELQTSENEIFDNIFENIPRTPDMDENQDQQRNDENTGIESLANVVVDQTQEVSIQPEVTDVADETTIVPNDIPEEKLELESVNNRISEILIRLDGLTQKIDTIDERQGMARETSNNIEVDALKDTITALEKRVSVLSTKRSVSEKTVQKTQPKSTSSSKKTTRTVVTPKKSWTLRGASPGQAYVAEKGTRNIQNITIGDRLDGMGRIKSVALENGKWVVRGTSGTIRQ
jgi:hypothetical protein